MRFVPVAADRLECVYVEAVAKTDQLGVQKVAADGRPIWSVRVLARSIGTDQRPEIIEVAIPSLTPMGDNLAPFSPVELQGLQVFPWAMDGRSGLAFSAEGARTVKARNGAKVEASA